MAQVVFNSITKHYQGRDVLNNVSFELNANQKVGLIGANGCGKTTLLKILTGQIKPDSGKVFTAQNVRIGYVAQHTEYDDDHTVMEHLLDDYHQLQDQLRAIELEVSHDPHDDSEKSARLLRKYQAIRDDWDKINGDHFKARAEAMLEGIGLANRREHPVRLLSGGEQNVLGMASALLAEPNLLILDEPGNHLDFLGLAWLDDFLQRFRGSLLIVSHNRYLLDRVVDHILELEQGQTSFWPGNYTQYRQLKQEKLEAQQSQYEAQRQRVAHLESLVQKFADIAQGHASDQSWGKRLKSRRTQLERERSRLIDAPQSAPASVSINLQAEKTRADIALQVNNYSKSFGNLDLLKNISFEIAGSERWALVGPNGCGKTSFLRDIVQSGRWEGSTIRIGPSLSMSYCSQQQEVLTGDNTVYEELFSIPDVSHEKVLGILARFLFKDEDINKKIANLSGGERNRLQLARLMLLRPNFLILDEPTNHLDIATCEAVEEALSEFEGTVLVVSHDRYFLDKVVDHVAEIKDKTLVCFDGNYSDYWSKRNLDKQISQARIATRGQDVGRTEKSEKSDGGQEWKQKKAEAAARRKAFKTVEILEQQIAELEDKARQIEHNIADAYLKGDNDKGNTLSTELVEIKDRIEALMIQWEQATENLPDAD